MLIPVAARVLSATHSPTQSNMATPYGFASPQPRVEYGAFPRKFVCNKFELLGDSPVRITRMRSSPTELLVSDAVQRGAGRGACGVGTCPDRSAAVPPAPPRPQPRPQPRSSRAGAGRHVARADIQVSTNYSTPRCSGPGCAAVVVAEAVVRGAATVSPAITWSMKLLWSI